MHRLSTKVYGGTLMSFLDFFRPFTALYNRLVEAMDTRHEVVLDRLHELKELIIMNHAELLAKLQAADAKAAATKEIIVKVEIGRAHV